LRDGGVVRDGQPGGAGIEGVGDVDDDLAGQRVPYWLTTGTALSNSTARIIWPSTTAKDAAAQRIRKYGAL
jgi:hypothetical protein